MINNHWTCYGTEKSFVPNEDKFGFVYIITNTKNGKAYVGCKQYYSMSKKKTKHKWEMYTGSSKYLNKDIEKIGKEHFKFEVIAEYKNKRSLRYYEMYYQVKWNVLTATVEGSDNPAFYNSYVGGKFYRPIESYMPHTEETKIKMSKAQTGEKHPLYGKKHTEETIRKMREAKLGENNYWYGKKHTEETKNKMREAHTGEDNPMYGKKHTEEAKRKISEARLKRITKVKYIDNEE